MPTSRHPEAELIAYVAGDLADRDARRVADHVATCSECARTTEDFRQILQDLERSVPRPPDINWGAYRAQLQEKLEARRGRSLGWQWRRWPLPLALTATAAAVLLVFAIPDRLTRDPLNGDLFSVEERVAASRLDFLRQYSMLERLDLWEDLDVVQRLDELPEIQEG